MTDSKDVRIPNEPRFKDKKQNAEYWDKLEDSVADTILRFEAGSANPRHIITEDDRIHLTKNVTELIVDRLEKLGHIFPYVDENM